MARAEASRRSEPLIVVIPHSIGMDESLLRIIAGSAAPAASSPACWRSRTRPERRTADVPRRGAGTARVRTSASMRARCGSISTLPWLLASFTRAVQRVVGQKGR